jgi:hypothetical protein
VTRACLPPVTSRNRPHSRESVIYAVREVTKPLALKSKAACPPHFQDYWSPTPLLLAREFRYQPRVPEQIRKSRSPRFFRPLLYQLSYLGGWRSARRRHHNYCSLFARGSPERFHQQRRPI